mmetsp:Transcript_68097/g.181188  ORF Transcript_68097/g.181188 Transcript_68097/m.181188 type:complete len:204 (+) Transcript_68097:525-1136(+)
MASSNTFKKPSNGTPLIVIRMPNTMWMVHNRVNTAVITPSTKREIDSNAFSPRFSLARFTVSQSSSRTKTACLNLFISVINFFFCRRMAKPFLPSRSFSLSLRPFPTTINSCARFPYAFFFMLYSTGLTGLGLSTNPRMRSIGRAVKPTPPNNTKQNHPMKPSRAVRKIWKLTWNDMELSCFSLQTWPPPAESPSNHTPQWID